MYIYYGNLIMKLAKINEHAYRGLFYVTSVLSWGYLGNKENVELRHNLEKIYITLWRQYRGSLLWVTEVRGAFSF